MTTLEGGRTAPQGRFAGLHAGLHAGWFAGVVFAVSLLVVAALTPGYEHAHQPVSFLGMRGAPFAPWWNLSGFGLPGLLAACFALSVQRPLRGSGAGRVARTGTWLLLVSGLAFAGNGVFAFDPQAPSGTSTRLHVAMLTISLLAFLPATVLLAVGVRRLRGWRLLSTLGPLLALGALLSVLQRMADVLPVLQGNPGYAQRITLALYFLWLALAALVAVRAGNPRLPGD
jgi:hypothetical membrane protein